MRSFFVQVSSVSRSVVVLAVDAGGSAEALCGLAIDHLSSRRSSVVNFRPAALRSDHQSQIAATMSSAKAIGPCGHGRVLLTSKQWIRDRIFAICMRYDKLALNFARRNVMAVQ
jgi:hypothetical protein